MKTKYFKKSFCVLLIMALVVTMTPVLAFGTDTRNNNAIKVSKANFPDNNFRSYVLAVFDIDNNGSLSESELDQIKSVNVEGKSVYSLKGIEHFYNLEKLITGPEKMLKNIDISKNEKLNTLNVKGSGLEYLNVLYNSELVEIDASATEIASIYLYSNTKLKYLDVSNTNINELEVERCKDLDFLNCSDNKLTFGLRLGNNKKLKTLLCNKCQLEYLNLKNNVLLEELSCMDNDIFSLDLSKNTMLESITAEGNFIDTIKLPANYTGDISYLNKQVKLAKRADNSFDNIKSMDSFLDHMDRLKNTYNNFQVKYENLIINKDKRTVSLEEGCDAGKITYGSKNSIIEYEIVFYYGEPDFTMTVRAPYIKLNNNTYKVESEGSQNFAKLTVKDRKGELLQKYEYKVRYEKEGANQYVGVDLPGKYKVTVYGDYGHYGKYSFNLIVTPVPVESLYARLCKGTGGYDDVILCWFMPESEINISGYQIYARRPNINKTWKLIGTTTKTSFITRNLYDGYKYEFKVIPYHTVDGIKYRTLNKYITRTVTTLMKVKAPVVKRYNNSSVRVNWNNIYGESGYQISRAIKKDGTYIAKTVQTTTGKTTILKAPKGLRYYKVRAYKTIYISGNAVKVYAPWSEPKAYTMK